MSDRGRVLESNRGGVKTWGVAVVVGLVCASVLAGCAGETQLVNILSTEGDGTIRHEAAAKLARRHSVQATQQLVAAAENDSLAAAGLDALAEEYGVVLSQTVQEAAETSARELSEEAVLRLRETITCLSYMGTPKAIAVLGSFVSLDGEQVAGVKDLQVASLDILADLGSEEAIAELMRVGGSLGPGPYGRSLAFALNKAFSRIAGAAVGPLVAVAGSDEWAREALAGIGADAVPGLLDVLGAEKWAEAVLAEIGEPAVEAVSSELSSSEENVAHRALGVLLRMYETREPVAVQTLLTQEMAPVLLADLMNPAFGSEDFETSADGFDHVFMAERALAEIGEPAIEQVWDSAYPWKWRVLEMMGADAVPALMAAMTGKDRGESLQAAAALARMRASSPGAVQALTDALEQGDLQSIATNYLYYIALGEAGTEDLIADALLAYGKRQMALDCLNCGNETLVEAARKWASRHGSRERERRSRSGVPFPSWGYK